MKGNEFDYFKELAHHKKTFIVFKISTDLKIGTTSKILSRLVRLE